MFLFSCQILWLQETSSAQVLKIKRIFEISLILDNHDAKPRQFLTMFVVMKFTFFLSLRRCKFSNT